MAQVQFPRGEEVGYCSWEMGSLLWTLTVTLWSNKLWLTSLHSILCWVVLPGHNIVTLGLLPLSSQ